VFPSFTMSFFFLFSFRLFCLDRSQLVQVRAQQLCPLKIIRLVQFLIRRMRSIIASAHRKQEDIHTERIRKSERDGDRTALPSQIRFLHVNLPCCLLGSLKVPVIVFGDPWFASMQVLDVQLTLRVQLCEFCFEELEHERFYEFRSLWR